MDMTVVHNCALYESEKLITKWGTGYMDKKALIGERWLPSENAFF